MNNIKADKHKMEKAIDNISISLNIKKDKELLGIFQLLKNAEIIII